MSITKEITGSKTLVIAATGFANKLGLPVEVFFKAAGLAETSKIIVMDPTKHKTLGGLQPEFPTFFDLIQYLKEEVAKYSPEQLTITGTSGGAYTAMLFGHLLKANYVVAFSTYPYLTAEACKNMGDPSLKTMARLISELDKLPDNVKEYYDLKYVLAKWNGVTKYYNHVSRFNKWDHHRALYLKNTPGVTIIAHPYFTHGITGTLAAEGRLSKCFKFPYSKKNRLVNGHYFLKTTIIQYFKRVFSFISRRIFGD